MNLQAVVVDDEPAGRKAVRDHCRAHPDIEVIAECASGVDALEIIGQWRPQVAFIDVQMKPLTGIDVATRLAPEDTPVIVFVTAFDEYAVRAFDLNAVDYLLKPFDEGDRNYIVIAVGQRSYRVRATLAAIEERLSDRRFVRVHRSVIVNASMIRTVEKWFHGEYSIEMHSGRRFTSGRIYRQRIQGLVLRRRGHPESDAEVD